MADEKRSAPGFMTYREAAIMFSLMPEHDAAQAIKATCEYYLYHHIRSDLTGTALQVFHIMQADIDRNNAKYQEVVKRNRRNIESRWGKAHSSGIPVVDRSNTNNKPETINNKPEARSQNTGGVIPAAPPSASRFTPPTLADVQAYVAERRSVVDPQAFIDFYESNGWMVGKSPMRDWKAACRNAESWDRWKRQKDGRNTIKTSGDYGKESFFND